MSCISISKRHLTRSHITDFYTSYKVSMVTRGKSCCGLRIFFLTKHTAKGISERRPLYPDTCSQRNPPEKCVRIIVIHHFCKRPIGTSPVKCLSICWWHKDIYSDLLAHQETEKFFRLTWIVCRTGMVVWLALIIPPRETQSDDSPDSISEETWEPGCVLPHVGSRPSRRDCTIEYHWRKISEF